MDGKKFFPSQIPQIAGLGGDYHLFKELQCSACGSERRNFSPVSPTTLSSQLNGELAGQAQAPDRGVGVSKVFQEVGRWQTVGKESLCRLRGQQLYDTTRCGVWQGVVSAVGRAGTQHMERIFLKESSLPPFLLRVEEWGPSMLQATDQLLLLVEVTGGPKEFLFYSFGLVLAAREPAVPEISWRYVFMREGSSTLGASCSFMLQSAPRMESESRSRFWWEGVVVSTQWATTV